ncbi:hypothetical protein [Stenomitos frigidus]|uniref:hypothetical protein n=1 Tax=Stenomitos frigidus TaxID=1886765 RepID=UPI001C631C40|nr:hypothetical protein [Stenomitos frigidus]
MTDPLFWLVLSLLFVTISLTIVLVVAIPTLRELSRAARSAEKLFDTLRSEFPPTLQAIRLTGLEISDLTDDVSEGVQSAGQVVKQVDQSLSGVRQQAQRVQYSTRSVVVGIKAAWRTFTRSSRSTSQRRSSGRLPIPRPDPEFNTAVYDSERYDSEGLRDTLPETTRNARRATSQDETLTRQPARAHDASDLQASDPRASENGLPAPSPHPVERSRSTLPTQSNPSTATPDPPNRYPGAETADRRD